MKKPKKLKPDVGPAFFKAVDELLEKIDRTKGSTRCTCTNADGLIFVCTRCQLHEAAAKVRNFTPK